MTRLVRPANKDWHRGWIPGEHRGQDFGWGNGDQIYAAMAGTVISVYGGGGYNGGWGNRIIIQAYPGVQHTYNHIANGGIYVSVGDEVDAGQYIATMGSTGNSTATHLHFELYLDGERVDPQPYYTQDIPGTPVTPDPAPPVPAGAKRFWNGPGAANLRSEPRVGDNLIDTIAGGDYGDFKAWTHGETVNGQDVWLQGYHSGNWAWIGSFTSTDLTGLPEVTVDIPTPPTREPYEFEAFDPTVTDVIPTILGKRSDTGNKAERGNFPAQPEKAVIHDFGDVNVHTYSSVIYDFTNDNGREVSSHFVVGYDNLGALHVTQMVALTDRAYHAGPGGNDFIGIEVDPRINYGGEQALALKKAVGNLLDALERHYGYRLGLIEHNQVPGANTRCGDDIDLSWWDETTVEPAPEPEPEPNPVPVPELDPDKNTENLNNSGEKKNPDAPLAGLLDRYPVFRFWFYILFAVALLALSLVPDALMAGIIPADQTEAWTRWAFFLTSAMSKVGAAFGFIAAANVGKKQ